MMPTWTKFVGILLGLLILCSLPGHLPFPDFRVTFNLAAEKIAFLSSFAEQQNVTTFQGDLILLKNDTFLVKDARFELHGNILMKDNSTLTLSNAVLVAVLEHSWQYNFTMHDNSTLRLERNSKILSGIFDFKVYDNSVIDLSDSELEKGLVAEPSSAIDANKSRIRSVDLIGDISGKSHLSMINSNATSISSFGGDATIVDSRVESITVLGQIPTSILLMNSTYDNLEKDQLGRGVIYVGWHLIVSLESRGRPLGGTLIEVYYAHNSSLAAEKVTGEDGNAKFDLLEWEITELGSLFLGDYIVKTKYSNVEKEETISLRSSMHITLEIGEVAAFLNTNSIALIAITVGVTVVIIGTYSLKKRKQKLAIFRKPAAQP